MNINKKFDRMKQWGKERMGGEVKTGTNEEFKALELEMQLRGDGMPSTRDPRPVGGERGNALANTVARNG